MMEGTTRMPVINRIAEMSNEIATWRHDLHERAELLFDVHRTAGSHRQAVVIDGQKASF